MFSHSRFYNLWIPIYSRCTILWFPLTINDLEKKSIGCVLIEIWVLGKWNQGVCMIFLHSSIPSLLVGEITIWVSLLVIDIRRHVFNVYVVWVYVGELSFYSFIFLSGRLTTFSLYFLKVAMYNNIIEYMYLITFATLKRMTNYLIIYFLFKTNSNDW